MNCKICGIHNCEKLEDGNHLVSFPIEEDIEGHFHHHDRNGRWQEWKCSKGHVFRCAAYNQCWCGWTSQYPELSNIHQFKKRPPCKGVKFSNKVVITNKKHIEDLIERIPKRECQNRCLGILAENSLRGDQ